MNSENEGIRPLNIIGLSPTQELLITSCDLRTRKESHFAAFMISQETICLPFNGNCDTASFIVTAAYAVVQEVCIKAKVMEWPNFDHRSSEILEPISTNLTQVVLRQHG